MPRGRRTRANAVQGPVQGPGAPPHGAPQRSRRAREGHWVAECGMQGPACRPQRDNGVCRHMTTFSGRGAAGD